MTAIAERREPEAPERRATIVRALAWAGWPPFLVAFGALVVLVWLGRDMTFYHDEYSMILLRDLSWHGILAPHNEHLSATLVILYRVLLGTVGMASYWPYLGVTFALHVIVAGIVYVVVRREASAAWALGAMAVMLMLGAGGDDILWAFQSGTVGAVAAGMAAVVVAPRRPAAAAILLTIALATSGAALAFVVGTGLHLLLTRPRAIVWLLLPVGLYLAWYIAYGSSGITALRSPSLQGVPEYVLSGLTASAAGALGSTAVVVGQIGLLALAFGLGRARAVPPVVVALVVSGVAFFFIAGLVRAHLGPEQATAPRYVYIVAPALIVAGTVLLARVPKPLGTVAGAVVLVVALVGNTALMFETHDRLVSKIECERGMTPLARGSAGNPC
jgi:hypothetical protein